MTAVEKKAVVLDVAVGNLGNVIRALRAVGATPAVSRDSAAVAAARCLVLPGVGAFGPPREALRGDLESALRMALERGAWLFGICVGFQILFEAGEEFGETDGLGLLPGRVRRLPDDVPLPHIGWNRLHRTASKGNPLAGLLAGVPDGSSVYYVHSFAPEGGDPADLLAETPHGRLFPAMAGRGRVAGAQFHPEKSGSVGLRILRNFTEMAHAAP
ncbi:MAG: imidazole glycerol phosphate synthase subunit HisH [Acidobacteriota bacterium]